MSENPIIEELEFLLDDDEVQTPDFLIKHIEKLKAEYKKQFDKDHETTTGRC